MPVEEAESVPPRCSDSHGINPKRWGVYPHPTSACAELIEMGKADPTFLQAVLAAGDTGDEP